MLNEEFIPSNRYFAAKNSHKGFKSLFREIFNPEDFERIFILKGGPGTGKSSLMKQVGAEMTSEGCVCDAIYCSSDPKSLDGIIIYSDHRKVAIIDGTAPHTADPKYPGAAEEIINLGESFDTDKLNDKRKDIIALNKIKSSAYADGYSLLKVAGSIFDYIWERLHEHSIYNQAETVSYEAMSFLDLSQKTTFSSTKILSSFGKCGYTRMPLNKDERDIINLVGDGFSTSLVMSILASKLRASDLAECICQSALDDRLIDRIYTPKQVITANEYETQPTLIVENLTAEVELAAELSKIYEELLTLSMKRFQTASVAHFQIEDIYVNSMNFENNDKITDTVISKIRALIQT